MDGMEMSASNIYKHELAATDTTLIGRKSKIGEVHITI